MTDERDDALVLVVGVDPLEAVGGVGPLPERGVLVVELVERRDEGLLVAVVLVVVGEEVLDALVVAPLDELGDLVAHEVELRAGVGHLVERQRAHARELAPVVARLARDERALAVHDLVMRERQHEILVELVHGRERQQLVVAGTVREVRLHVVEGVVHPAHVPLEVEAEAAVVDGIGDQRPCRGLLGDHHDVVVVGADDFVATLDELDRDEVLLAALLVELLEAGVIDAEVEVEHRGDAVDADAVCVVLVDPVEEVGDQEALDLAAAEVELEGAPVGVLLLLEELLAVEVDEAVLVTAEAAGDPVEDDADALLVAGVDEVLELLGVAVARGGGEVARHLVAPGAVEGVLHDGHQLDVGVAHALDVAHELLGELVVGEVGAAVLVGVGVAVAGQAVVVALPAAEVHLEDVERLLHEVGLGALRHVLLVAPLVAGDVGRARRGARRALRIEGVGVGLVEEVAHLGLDEVLVELALDDAGDEAVPHAAVLGAREVVGLGVPAVELADDADALDVGSPDRELVSLGAAIDGRVGTHLLVAAVPVAAREHIKVFIG